LFRTIEAYLHIINNKFIPLYEATKDKVIDIVMFTEKVDKIKTKIKAYYQRINNTNPFPDPYDPDDSDAAH